MEKLDKRKRDFCKFKAQGYSNVDSAMKAGYTEATAKTKAHKWLEKSEIKAEIEKWQAKTEKIAEEKFNYTVEESFKKLNQIQELALLQDEKGNFSNLSAAIKAEELKGKMCGVYKADNEQKTTGINIFVSNEKDKQAIEDI